MDEYDAIIVGGGMSGLETANHLQLDRVCVLEAGRTKHLEPVSVAQWCRPEQLDADWWPYFTSSDPLHFSKGFGIRSRLGGRSLCWHGISLPMEPYAFDERWSSEAVNWVTNSAEPFVRHQNELFERCVVPSSSTLGNYQNAPILMGSKTNAARPDGVYTPLETRAFGEYDVKLGCRVEAIHKTGKRYRIDAVRDGVKCVLYSPIVVFASSAAMNARFFSQLCSHAKPLFIRDHIVVGRTAQIRVDRNIQEFALQFKTISEIKARVFVSIAEWEYGVSVDLWTMGSDKQSFNASIADSHIAVEAGSIATKYAQRCHELFEIADLQFKEIIAELELPEPEYPSWESRIDSHEATIKLAESALPPDIAVPFEGLLGASDHEHGTVPFGVIGQYGQLAEAPGIFFVGPSCFPSLGGTNPSLPTLAQCRTTAEHISSR